MSSNQNDKTTGNPPIIGRCLNRTEWAEYVRDYDFGKLAPAMVVLHHTFIPKLEDWAGKGSVTGMQRYYNGLGWSAGPHLIAAPEGIWLFTPMHDVGIHANAANANAEFIKSEYRDFSKLTFYSLGLEMVGDYDRQQPSGEVWQNSLAVLGGLVRRLGIPIEKLLAFHREYNKAKSCPGHAVTKPWVISQVTGWLAQPYVTSTLSGVGRAYICSARFFDFYHRMGGLTVLGLALSDEYSKADPSGEVCRWMHFECGVIKLKPSQKPPYDLRLAPLGEVAAFWGTTPK